MPLVSGDQEAGRALAAAAVALKAQAERGADHPAPPDTVEE
ncbi:hypothetical protein [Streptomyces colonosanans]|nr:hypothetical protein [Streptomyces colonosanans]